MLFIQQPFPDWHYGDPPARRCRETFFFIIRQNQALGEGELLHRRQQAPQFPLPVARRQSPANLDGLQIHGRRIPNDEVTLLAVLVVMKRLPPAVQFDGHDVFQYPAPVFREILRHGNKARIHEIYLFGVHNPLPGGIGKFVGTEDEKGFLEIGEVIRQGALAARSALAFEAFFESRQGEQGGELMQAAGHHPFHQGFGPDVVPFDDIAIKDGLVVVLEQLSSLPGGVLFHDFRETAGFQECIENPEQIAFGRGVECPFRPGYAVPSERFLE